MMTPPLPATTILTAAVVILVALPNPVVGAVLVILSPIPVLVLPAVVATLMALHLPAMKSLRQPSVKLLSREMTVYQT